MKYDLYRGNKLAGEAISHHDGTFSVVLFDDVRFTQRLTLKEIKAKRLKLVAQ